MRSRTAGASSMAISIASASASNGTISGPKQPLDWGRSFHPRSLEFCLNLRRPRRGRRPESRGDYVPGSSGYYAIGDEPLRASRRASDRHQFVTLEFSREHLQKQLADCEADLDPQMRAAVFPEKANVDCLAPAPDDGASSAMWSRRWRSRRCRKPAQILWYQSKALELMAHFLFRRRIPEFFCMRQKRVARERVERDEGIARARSGQSADAGNARPGSGMQPVLSEPDFFARSRPDDSAISAQTAHGTRRRTFAQRPLQRHRGCDRSRLLQPEPFQQSLLRNDRLLSGSLSDGEERRFSIAEAIRDA